jgi:hypothetical protein
MDNSDDVVYCFRVGLPMVRGGTAASLLPFSPSLSIALSNMSTSTPRILLASTLTPDSMEYLKTLNRVHIEQPSEKSPMPTEELMERVEGQ